MYKLIVVFIFVLSFGLFGQPSPVVTGVLADGNINLVAYINLYIWTGSDIVDAPFVDGQVPPGNITPIQLAPADSVVFDLNMPMNSGNRFIQVGGTNVLKDGIVDLFTASNIFDNHSAKLKKLIIHYSGQLFIEPQ